MRISDWSSDVCSSDLPGIHEQPRSLRIICRPAVSRLRWKPDRGITTEAAPDRCTDSHAGCARATYLPGGNRRSEERRVGQEGVRTCRSRWAAESYKQNILLISEKRTNKMKTNR